MLGLFKATSKGALTFTVVRTIFTEKFCHFNRNPCDFESDFSVSCASIDNRPCFACESSLM